MSQLAQPDQFVLFGPGANCTLAQCPISWSVYKYRPSLVANITFLALYFVALVVHVLLGVRWRTPGFAGFMSLGCIVEIVGYVGRILLYMNPFSFPGFMIQVIFITSGPVFYTGSIYFTLSHTIEYLDESMSRFPPKLFYYVFLPSDILCLVLQAVGGALSTASQGTSGAGVDVALAGLALQVAVTVVFCAFFLEYVVRYVQKARKALTRRVKMFFGFLTVAIVSILARCIYRCYELSQGYQDSDLITNEGLFIGLEGVYVGAS